MRKAKTIIFVALVVVMIIFLNKIFMPNALLYEKNQEIEDLDYIMLGSSNVFDTFNTLEIWNQTGYIGYDLGYGNQTIPGAYFQLNEELKTSVPKVVFFDCYSFLLDYGYDSFNHLGMDNYPLNRDKIELLYNASYNEKSLYMVPFLQYHNRWSELNDIDFRKEKYNQKTNFMGYNPAYNIYECSFEIMPDDVYSPEFSQKNLEYFDKIASLCEEKGIELVLIKTPSRVWGSVLHNQTEALAEEYNLPFVEMNTQEYFDSINLDMATDFRDEGDHLNYSGGLKISNWFAGYLKENYGFKDKRGTSGYEKYDTMYQNMVRYEYINKLSTVDTVSEYMQLLDDENTVKVVTAAPDAYSAIGPGDMQKALAMMGINQDFSEYVYSYYCAIMDGTNITSNQYSNTEVSILEDMYNHKIFVETTPNQSKKLSKIQIDDVNYSMNAWGVNIVVYDKVTDMVISTVNVTVNNGNLILVR